MKSRLCRLSTSKNASEGIWGVSLWSPEASEQNDSRISAGVGLGFSSLLEETGINFVVEASAMTSTGRCRVEVKTVGV